MTTRVHSDLRALALAFYRGWLTRDKYLLMRGEYLTAISRGKEPKPINQEKLRPPKPSAPTPDDDEPEGGSSLRWIMGTTILLAVIVIIWFAMSSAPQPVSETNPSEGKTSGTEVTETEVSRFNDYISNTFTSQKGWDEETLNILKFKWQALSQQDQQTIRGGKAFKDFTNLLVLHVNEERKLDNIVPSDRELLLITTARNLSLLEMIKAPE